MCTLHKCIHTHTNKSYRATVRMLLQCSKWAPKESQFITWSSTMLKYTTIKTKMKRSMKKRTLHWRQDWSGKKVRGRQEQQQQRNNKRIERVNGCVDEMIVWFDVVACQALSRIHCTYRSQSSRRAVICAIIIFWSRVFMYVQLYNQKINYCIDTFVRSVYVYARAASLYLSCFSLSISCILLRLLLWWLRKYWKFLLATCALCVNEIFASKKCNGCRCVFAVEFHVYIYVCVH